MDLIFALLDLLGLSLPEQERSLTWGRLLRSFVTAAGMLTAIWISTLQLNGWHIDPERTDVLFPALFSAAVALLAFPLGYYGSRLTMALAKRSSIKLPRWVLIGTGVFLFGLLLCALSGALVLGICGLAPLFHWSLC